MIPMPVRPHARPLPTPRRFSTPFVSPLTLAIALLLLPTAPAVAEEVTRSETASHATWREVRLERPIPSDLTAPEGRTRWELTELELGAIADGSVLTPGGSGSRAWERRRQIRDAAGQALADIERWSGDATQVERWLLPQTDPQLWSPAARTLALVRDGEEVALRTRRVGLGWLFLPSGPREVVLERVEHGRLTEDGSWGGTRRLEHRWVEPRQGVVARVWGPPAPGGRERLRIDGAEIVEGTIETTRGPGLRIYSDEVVADVFTKFTLGINLGEDVPIDGLVPTSTPTISDLVALGAWDFSGISRADAIDEWRSTVVPNENGETCSQDACGFTQPVVLSREDRVTDTEVIPTITGIERVETPSEVTLFLRATVRNEGQAGALGEGESRLCYFEDGRTEVPLWQFNNQDAQGFFMQVGDTWTSGTFQCEQNINNNVCPNSCGLFCPLYTGACGDFAGNQRGEVLAEGPVTLPSGHTFQSQVVVSTAEFCVYLFSSCGSPVDTVRQAIYLWQIPTIGTVSRISSLQRAEPDEFSFTLTSETDFKYGLFPPRGITVDATADTTISISWDPGLETSHIDGYKVYWDVDSGGTGDYAFDSAANPGQVSINGTTATISGLTPGTDYFVTVTSLSNYLDPATNVTTDYESLLFPTTVPGSPEALPVEVIATTSGGACIPTEEVQNLTVSRLSPTDVEICWDAVSDPCPDGYDVLAAAAPNAFENFSVVATPGLVTCQTLTTNDAFFLVNSRGARRRRPAWTLRSLAA